MRRIFGATCCIVMACADVVCAVAQTALPPVTVVAPEQRRIRRAAETRPAASRVRNPAVNRVARTPQAAAVALRSPSPTAAIGALLPVYPGGQVASGQRIGILGNRGFLDTPFSTTSYTSEYIRNQQARTLGDVLASEPGVRVTLPSTGFADQVSVRGFTLFGRDATLDGLAGVVPARRLPFDSIERVELLRGPATLLVGLPPAGSIAGTLNYVPKRATDDPIARMTAGFISDGNLGTAIDVGRRFGDAKEFGVRVNGSFRDGATPLPGQTDRLGNAAVGLDYRGERFRASFDAGAVNQFQRQYSQIILSVARGALVPPAPAATTTLSQPWQFVPIQAAYAMGRAEYDVFDNTTVGIGYGQMSSRERSVQTFLTNLRSNGDLTATPAIFPWGYDTRSADVSLRTKFDTGPLTHQMAVVGTALSVRDSLNVSVLGPAVVQNIYRPFNAPEPVIGNVISGVTTSQSMLTGVAIADVISALNDRVQMTIGGRQQRIDIDGFAQATGRRNGSFSGERFSPAYGVLVKPANEISLYANMSEGLFQGPTAPAGSANAGAIFEPAVARQREAGVKFDRNGFGAQIALFEITQVANAVDLASNRFGVIGLQRNRGAEFQLFGQPAPGFRLLGGVSLIDGRLTQTPGGRNDGRKALGVPDVQVTFAPEFDLPTMPNVTLTGRAIYTSGVFFDAENTQALPGWMRFDIGARYKTQWQGRPVTIRASVENILNENYWQAAARQLLSLGAPRTFLMSATIDF